MGYDIPNNSNPGYPKPHKLTIPEHITYQSFDRPVKNIKTSSGYHWVWVFLIPVYQSYSTGAFENANVDSLDINARIIDQFTCKRNKNLKHVSFGDSVQKISGYAFFECWSADGNISFSENSQLQSIAGSAFCDYGKNGWTYNGYLNIPPQVEEIGVAAFQNCKFTGITFQGDKIAVILGKTFKKAIKSGNSDLVLPNSLSKICYQAFYQCKFNTLTTGRYLRQIHEEAFYGCDQMHTMTLNRNLDSIGKKAFANCTSLSNVTCLNGNPPALGANAFQNIASNATLTVPAGSFDAYYNSAWHNYFPNIIEDGIGGINFVANNIRYRVNEDNTSVTIVGPAEGVTLSGTQVFGNTVSYNGNTYNVTKIGNYAFNQCSGITVVSIQSPIEEVGDCAFSWCTQLNSVALPNTLKRIGYGAFGICPNMHLSTAGFPNSLEEIGDFAFWGCALNNVSFGNGLKSIGMGAFIGGGISGQLNLPNSLEYIGDGAFESCPGLTGNLTIPNSVKYIGDYAFWQCPNLTGTLNIPGSVIYLGIGAFKECTGFTGQLHTPSNMTEIPKYAFYGCTGITGWTCPDRLKLIDENAFSYSGLQTLMLGADIDSIGSNAFTGCASLVVVDLRYTHSIPNISYNSFENVPCTTVQVPCGKANYCSQSAWGLNFSNFEAECHDGYSFDDNTFEGWTTIDADGDGHDWFVKEQYEFHPAHTGSYYAASESYSNSLGTWLYPDNYLVSPQKGRYNQIRFYARAEEYNHPAEHFGVAISTEGNTDPDDFTTIQEWTMTAKDAGSWHEYTVDLSSYSNIWVAIRHFNCTDQSSLCVDDISLEPIPVIDQIQIDGFTAPSWGEHPDFDLELVDGLPYTIVDVQWHDYGVGLMTPSDVFDIEDNCYYLRVYLEPAEGYSFDPDAVVLFNGDSSNHDYYSNVIYDNGNISVETFCFYLKDNNGVGEQSAVNLAVYPNPTSGNVKIKADNLRNIEIYNMMGQKVFETEASGNEFEYNFGDSTGMFLIKVETEQGVETRRVVVM